MSKIVFSLFLMILLAKTTFAQNCMDPSRCDELGYTKTATDCAGLDTLVCPFDENKVFCVGAKAQEQIIPCDTGAVLYSDKNCHTNASAARIPIAVVFDAENRLAVALDEAKTILRWGGHKEIGSAAQGTSGKSNTAAILAYGKANNFEYPAAEYCNTYSTAGTKAGDWFLPSLEELKLLSNNFSGINSTLKILGKPTLPEAENGHYWSSSEDAGNVARGLILSSGALFYGTKAGKNRVRPVLAF